MSGVIVDPSGAPIAGAKIQARHLPTGRVYEAGTTDAGLYVLPSLPTGPYTVSFEQAGFKKLEQSNIEIRVAQRQILNASLEIGNVQETVEVTAAPPLLNTQTSEVGQNFSVKMMDTLPLFTGGIRNPEAFVSYMPGVNSVGEVSITGSGGRAKEVLIDGASQTIPESGGVVFTFPASEQFGEFKLITSNYNAEYGRFGGGLELFITRSGTNDLHGGAFWNIRRDIFNAAGWAVNSNTRNTPGFRPKERYNEIGGVIGGPVFIPKVYDGRNKTFWFFTYDTDRRPATISAVVRTLPTTLMKQGNFSQVSQAIYDPATTSGSGASATRLPFAGNLIPTSRFSKVSQNMLSAIPDTNLPGITNNFAFVNQSVFDDKVWSLKFDHSFTDNQRVAVYLNLRNQNVGNTNDFPGPLGTGLGVNGQKPENYRLNHDWVISATKLLHTTFGFTRQQQTWDNPAQAGFASKIGIPTPGGQADATPRVQFTGADGLSNWGVQDGKVANGFQNNWTFHFNQHFSMVKGKHDIKMGYDVRRLRTFANDYAGSNGLYVFSRSQTASPSALAATGHAFASLLVGAPDSASQTALPISLPEIRYQYYAGYAQDNWKLTSRFTLNVGLRYEVPVGYYDALDAFTSIDRTKPNPKANNFPGALVYAGSGPGRIGKSRFYPTDFSNIGPRVGFAWQLTNQTVLRGGYGIYYQTLGNGGCGCRLGFSGVLNSLSDGLNPAFQWDGGVPVPAGFQPPPFIDPSYANGLDVDLIGPNFGKAARMNNWSLSLQHEYKGFLFEGSYVGNRGNRLNSTLEANQVPTSYLQYGALLRKSITDPDVVKAGFGKPYPSFPDNGTLAQALRPFPQYLSVSDRNSGDGKIWYDSLQTKVERRFGSAQLMLAYTFSKTLSQLHYRQIFSQTQTQAQDNYNLSDAKSYSPFDQPHVFNALGSWDLPFGRGHKFLSGSNRLVNGVIGGWTMGMALQYRSSSLLLVSAPNTIGNGVLFTRFKKANTTGQDIKTGVSRTDLDPNNPNIRWFNPGAFSLPGDYQLGYASNYLSDFRNPRVLSENISLVKRVTVWERVAMQFRADFFNLFNRTNFGGINGTIGNANFGRAQAAQTGPRIITMGFRLDF